MKHIFARIRSAYGNLKIRYKFFITCMVLLIIPILFAGIVFNRYFVQTMEQQTNRLALQAIKQSEQYIDYLLREVENYSEVFCSNSDIQVMLKKRYSSYDEVNDYKKLLNQIDSIKSRNQVFDVNLFVSDEKLYARDNEDIFPLSSLEGDQYYKELVSMQEKPAFWTENHIHAQAKGSQSVLSYMMLVRDYSDIRKITGCMVIDILESQLGDILAQIDFGGSNQVFMLNGNLNIVASANKDEKSIKLMDEVLQQLKADGEALHDGYKIFKAGGENQFVVLSRMERLNWTIVSAVPTKEAFYETNRIGGKSFVLLLLSAVFGALIAALLSIATTRRIEKLTEKIRNTYDFGGSPELPQSDNPVAGDEVTVLAESYDSMLSRIHQLIEENYEVEIARREEQFKALQAQINPHFLYNIFDMINWMAIRIKADNISETLGMVADFYRISISDGREIITLREEFKHAELYMELQKKRQHFESSIELPSGLEECKIPKLVVQPIVENAIIHGIKQKPLQRGKVSINAEYQGEEVVIFIRDNAAEIDLPYVESVLSGENRASGAYGLKNVDERIKLYFGREYGLRYRKIKDGEGTWWTVAEIHIPGQKESSPDPLA